MDEDKYRDVRPPDVTHFKNIPNPSVTTSEVVYEQHLPTSIGHTAQVQTVVQLHNEPVNNVTTRIIGRPERERTPDIQFMGDITRTLSVDSLNPHSSNNRQTIPTLPNNMASINMQPPVNPVSMTGIPAEFFMQMMGMMQQMSERLCAPRENKVRINDIFLPSFDPDSNVGIREWCQNISKAVEIYKLSDFEVRMKVSGLLKGRAKLWADDWMVNTSSWEELQSNLITTFEPENRYSRDIMKFREHVYDSSKDISEFLSRAWILWKRITKDKLKKEDVEAVIGCINDERLRIELLNARAASVPELISVAASIRTKRTHPTPNSQAIPNKRARITDNSSSSLYCRICKRNNHASRDCRYKPQETPQIKDDGKNTIDKAVENKDSSQTRPSCTYCKKIGHTYDNCFRRDRALTSNINCVGDTRLTPMKVKIGALSLHAVFDSGAECSVMRESTAAKLPGKRNNSVNYLRGLGQFPVLSLASLETVCEIDGINTELKFFILPDYEMTSDVLVGMDLINGTNLSVLVTTSGSKLVRQPTVMHIQSKNPVFDDLDCDLKDEKEIGELRILLDKYQHLFIRGYPDKRVNTGELEIRLKNADKYVERRPYRLSPVERQKVREIIQDLLDHNIIRESKSPYSSPIILVKKKSGEDRMCVDYRELNSNTLRDHYPLPLISDQIDQLANGRYYTSLDMAAGFHQIPIAENSIEKTSFVTPDGLYEYLTMPFGLSNACSVYQRCINRALYPLLGSVAQVYVDDVLSKCCEFTSGINNLERILIALQEAGFSINIDKCSFFKRSIEYLGNVIADGRVRPSPRKVEALVKSPVPTTVKQVRQFNGLAGYFRRFVPNFSRIMTPLYELTKQGATWEWTNRHEEARSTVIQHLTSAPVLTIFQEDAPIELYTDASSLAYGAVLVQVIDGREHAVAYMSMRTTDAESRYHSYELETLAVVRAIKHFRQYLYGRKFKVITDCNALKASKHKKDLLPRIHRWWAFLQNYDFEVEYRKGQRIQHADFFSRNPGEHTVNIMNKDMDWLKVEQRRDDSLRPMIENLTNGIPVSDYLIEDGVLKRIWQDPSLGSQRSTVVPKSFQWSLINSYHTALKHPGWEKTLQKIKDTYWFDKMNTIVRNFVDNCVICRTSKGSSGAVQVRLHPIQKPTTPFQVIHMDITGKLGTREDQEYVIVTIDAFTKYVLLYHSTKKDQHSALAALKRMVHLFGTPNQLIVDGGREFLGEFKAYCDRFGINIHTIAPGVSRANGQVERMMATLKNALVMIKNYETEQWHTALEELQLALNCTPHRVTGAAPLTLLTRRKHCVPPELITIVDIDEETIDFEALERHVQQRMITNAERDKQRFDQRKAKIHLFQRGDYVLIKNNPRHQTSLDLKFSEPYEVHRLLDNDRYLVKRVDGRGRPRKVAHDQLRRAPQPGNQATVSVESSEDDDQPAPVTMTTTANIEPPPRIISRKPCNDNRVASRIDTDPAKKYKHKIFMSTHQNRAKQTKTRMRFRDFKAEHFPDEQDDAEEDDADKADAEEEGILTEAPSSATSTTKNETSATNDVRKLAIIKAIKQFKEYEIIGEIKETARAEVNEAENSKAIKDNDKSEEITTSGVKVKQEVMDDDIGDQCSDQGAIAPTDDAQEDDHKMVIIKNIQLPRVNFLVRSLIKQKTGKNFKFFLRKLPYSKSGTGDCLLRFLTPEDAVIFCEKINGVKLNGRIIEAKFASDELSDLEREKKGLKRKLDPENDSSQAPKKAKTTDSTVNYDFTSLPLDVNDINTYHLHPQYLKNLGIKLPLTSSILVKNLHIEVDEAKLIEVFSLAGLIKDVDIVCSKGGIKAKIDFDHPVEAVQAISMFNNRKLYGREMSVMMLTYMKYKNLPLGLESIGYGLSESGEPIRAVRTAMEIRKIKDLLADLGRYRKVANVTKNTPFKTKYVKLQWNVEKSPIQSKDTNMSANKANANAPSTSNNSTSVGSTSSASKPTTDAASESAQTAVTPAVQTLGSVLVSQGIIPAGTNCKDLQSILTALKNKPTGKPTGPRNQPNFRPNAPNANFAHRPNPNFGPRGPNFRHPNPHFSQRQRHPNNRYPPPPPPPRNQNHNHPNVPPRFSQNQNNPNVPPIYPQNQGDAFNQVINQLMMCTNAMASNMMQPTMAHMGMANVGVGQTMESLNQMMNIGANVQQVPTGATQAVLVQQPVMYGNQAQVTWDVTAQPVAPQIPSTVTQKPLPPAAPIISQNMQAQAYNQSMPDTLDQPTKQKDRAPKEGTTSKKNDMLMFKYLPTSVTADALARKMREVGDLMFCELTGNGRAVVSFKTERDAGRCMRLFHRSKVDGKTIEVELA